MKLVGVIMVVNDNENAACLSSQEALWHLAEASLVSMCRGISGTGDQ